MLVFEPKEPIPQCLSHHTSLDAVKKILSDSDGNGICFHARSNMKKNDINEIKMGERLLIGAKEAFGNHKTLLKSIDGYYKSASVSFMKGEPNSYMVERYGAYRMDFDLRTHTPQPPFEEIVECEYYSRDDFEQFVKEYCLELQDKLKSAFKEKDLYGQAAFSSVTKLLYIESDIMIKLFSLKDILWQCENEWRYVAPLKGEEDYVPFYIPKDLLTGVTIFRNDIDSQFATNERHELQAFLDERKYHAVVSIAPIPS